MYYCARAADSHADLIRGARARALAQRAAPKREASEWHARTKYCGPVLLVARGHLINLFHLICFEIKRKPKTNETTTSSSPMTTSSVKNSHAPHSVCAHKMGHARGRLTREGAVLRPVERRSRANVRTQFRELVKCEAKKSSHVHIKL